MSMTSEGLRPAAPKSAEQRDADTMRRVLRAVCGVRKVPVDEAMRRGARSTHEAAWVRYIAVFLCTRGCGIELLTVARFFGRSLEWGRKAKSLIETEMNHDSKLSRNVMLMLDATVKQANARYQRGDDSAVSDTFDVCDLGAGTLAALRERLRRLECEVEAIKDLIQ